MAKIGFISDIHSNLQALEAVLAKLKELECEKIYCLGDIVGYGGSPAECIALIRDSGIISVMGNHDEYVTLLMDPRIDRLRAEIQEAIYWTQGILSMEDLRWLSSLPMQIETDKFTVLHASFVPRPWAYCLDERTFAENFKYQTVNLAFCGHSHSPLIGIEILDDAPYVDYIRKMKISPADKVMVNVGSVGQPRDRDPKACTVIYDPETREIELIRVDYDFEAAQAKIREVGLPERFATRLELGR